MCVCISGQEEVMLQIVSIVITILILDGSVKACKQLRQV